MLSRRRSAFVAGLPILGSSLKTNAGGQTSGSHSGTSFTSLTNMQKLAIAVGFIAITSLTTILAISLYNHRGYWQHFLFRSTPTAIQSLPFVIPSTAAPLAKVTLPVTEAPTGFVTPIATPFTGGPNASMGSTPDPPNSNSNSGLHLGQTKNAPHPPATHH